MSHSRIAGQAIRWLNGWLPLNKRLLKSLVMYKIDKLYKSYNSITNIDITQFNNAACLIILL